jgi:integral membrane protein (TIGR00529 family)
VIARRSLPLALLCGSVILGLFTLSPVTMFKQAVITATDLAVLVLALAVGFIPMIGGVMKESGQMDNLVNNLRIGRRGIMAVSPALMGLLPMPGGALFSAPVLEKSGQGVAEDLKVAVNIWFRHLLILVYPLSSDLIATTKMVGLQLYSAITYLFPTLVVATFLGFIFLILKIKGKYKYTEPFSLKKLMLPLFTILIAPVIDFTWKTLNIAGFGELGTLAGVVCAFILSVIVSPFRPDLKTVFVKMKPWNFSLILLGLFFFLNVFKASSVASLVAAIPIPPLLLCILAGFLLGAGTGRVLLPASIIFPIYMTTSRISPISFALIYTGLFFGYVISPVHPCLSITCEYFSASLKKAIRLLAYPALIILAIAVILSLII